MDQIHIRDLRISCIIGTKPEERENKQDVLINISLDCDLSNAGTSDRLEDTINYKTLKDQVREMVEKSEFFLIEKMATEVADMCLEDPVVFSVDVTVDKLGALSSARSVAVQIRRSRLEREQPTRP